MKIAIIGAGASGLMAACVIKRLGFEFTLYEREARAGKKLIATGNGQCNITNINISPERYHGDREFSKFALEKFNQYDLMKFLREIGIYCKVKGDKVYPYSFQASSVLDMLRAAEGMSERCEEAVLEIVPQNKKFKVISNKSEEIYDKVIVCCGGKVSRKLSGGGSYELLTNLGHTMTRLSPSIVQLKCEGTKALEGIKVNGKVQVGKRLEEGEVLFTSYGLSGPPILQLSRFAKGEKLKLDLTPDISFTDVVAIITERKNIENITLENLFTGFLNKKLGREIVKRCNLAPLSRLAITLSDKEIKSLASEIKGMEFSISDTTGFDNAQVTAGGINCREFSDKTMESLKFKGLYAAGEMLNVDGDCGGFNLQWAFSSAYLAAVSACGEGQK